MENEIQYAIFVSVNKHFELKNPEKFKEKIKEIADKRGEDYKEILSYYLLRHKIVKTQLTEEDKKHRLDGLDEAGERMERILKEWTT